MPCAKASLTTGGVAHHRKHPVQHRRSTCQARGHAVQMQVSAARHWQHACSITAAPVAHGATSQPTVAHAVHPRGQCPSRPATAHLKSLLSNPIEFFDRISSVARPVTRARSPVRSAPPSRRCADLMYSLIYSPTLPTAQLCVNAESNAVQWCTYFSRKSGFGGH